MDDGGLLELCGLLCADAVLDQGAGTSRIWYPIRSWPDMRLVNPQGSRRRRLLHYLTDGFVRALWPRARARRRLMSIERIAGSSGSPGRAAAAEPVSITSAGTLPMGADAVQIAPH